MISNAWRKYHTAGPATIVVRWGANGKRGEADPRPLVPCVLAVRAECCVVSGPRQLFYRQRLDLGLVPSNGRAARPGVQRIRGWLRVVSDDRWTIGRAFWSAHRADGRSDLLGDVYRVDGARARQHNGRVVIV